MFIRKRKVVIKNGPDVQGYYLFKINTKLIRCEGYNNIFVIRTKAGLS